jgi:uncharacterized alpha-E superfamily protein
MGPDEMMLSRVADSLYWISRLLERAEHTARLMEVQLNLMLDRGPMSSDRRWRHVLSVLGLDVSRERLTDTYSAMQALAFDLSEPSSILSSIASARENARQVREQISSEMWEQINRLFHEVRRLDVRNLSNTSPHDFLSSIREGIHLFQGITNSTMTHGEGWQFLELGRYLERARATCVLVGAHFREFPAPPDGDTGTGEHLEWVGLLRTCTAFEAFCKAYTADTRPDRVAEFLILHPRFPHSIRFSADRIASSLHAIGEISSARDRYEADRLAGRLRATIDFAQIDEIQSTGLQAFLDAILKQCALVHESLCETYIEYPIEAALAG